MSHTELSHSDVKRALEFVRDVQGVHDENELASVILAGLSELIPCDRVSLNELDISPGQPRVIPNPVPAWWGKLGGLYLGHFMEHPLWDARYRRQLGEVITFSDHERDSLWKSSVLYNEYFLSIDARHQMAVLVDGKIDRFVGQNGHLMPCVDTQEIFIVEHR